MAAWIIQAVFSFMALATLPKDKRERIMAGAWREVQERIAAGAALVRYQGDPARYASEVLNQRWWSKQIEVAESVRDNRRTAVKAGHSVGKTHGIGGLVQWHFDAFNPSITLTTAPTWSSIHDLLWGEIKNQRPQGAAGRLLDTMRLDSGPMHYAKGHNADSGAGFQGRHEARQLIVLDEAVGIPPYIWEAVDGMMTSPDCRLLVSYNPTQTSGPCFDLLEDPAWNVITISCLDHPNIAAELQGLPAPYPKAVSLTWVYEMLEKHCQVVAPADAVADVDCFEFPPGSDQWFRPNDIFRSRVLGLFPKQAAESVWDETALQAARIANLEPKADTLPEIGCDVARFGDDETVLYGGCKPVVELHETYTRQDTMETAGRVAVMAGKLAHAYGCEAKAIPIKIDDTGLGGGVTDRLTELGYAVVPINFGEKARDPDEYFNLRSELWFAAAVMGRKRGGLDLSRLSPDVYRKLGAQLRGAKYKIQSDKTLRVESKADMKKRIGYSPDDADAFNLWALPAGTALPGSVTKANPQGISRYTRESTVSAVSGGRFGRGESGRGWHRR